MRSTLRRLRAASKPPIPLSPAGVGGRMSGLRFPLHGGTASMDTWLASFKRSGTLFAIVSLLSESCATPEWKLYKKQPRDGRVRYTTGDLGSDMRTEVVQHPALKLLTKPNDFFTRFEFFEGANQHEELAGETIWVVDRDNALRMPTSLWYVRPDRMEPIPDPDNYLVGWVYTAPDGTQIPLQLDEVIQERHPDPTDPYRGFSPVGAIMPNIEQQRYATEYQRNLFINGADPGGIIQVPTALEEADFQELVDRWRETHQGVARAGAVGVLENGAQWIANGQTNKDLEYGNLRLTNRDEIREAFRIHKHKLGTTDDVNRANATTADETFNNDLVISRLNRRRGTLNAKLLPMFGDSNVEFDYDNPLVADREQENAELAAKTTAWATLVDSGADPDDAADVVGLPAMKMAERATQAPALPPNWVPAPPAPTGTGDGTDDSNELAALLRRELRPYTARALPAAAQNRRR